MQRRLRVEVAHCRLVHAPKASRDLLLTLALVPVALHVDVLDLSFEDFEIESLAEFFDEEFWQPMEGVLQLSGQLAK